jgi:ligand-binding sensor domain-containing protein/signal transduction histidine kinase
MRNQRWLFIAAWLLGLACSAPVFAGSPILRPGSPYTIDVWDTEDGLPQHSVITMLQTRDGYLWLGTLNGLARFDGRRFTVFDAGNAPGLKSSRIVRLFEDSQTNLWVGTENAGIALVHDGQITGPIGPEAGRENRLAAATEDAAGVVWLYTAEGQLIRYYGGKTDTASVGDSRASFCRALIAEKNGPVWIGTDTRQRGIQPGATFAGAELPLTLDVPAVKLDFLLASTGGGYWRFADGRIQKWEGNQFKSDFGAYPWPNAPVPITAACEDRDGNLIVGTPGSGVYWFDAAGHVTQLSTEQGLSKNFILSLTMDREGSLWVGTDGGGLNRVKRQVFTVAEQTREQTVQSVSEDAGGGLWIGINSGGLNYWKDGRLKTFREPQGLLNLYVRSVFVDRAQRVWAGTYGGGLFQLQGDAFQRAPLSEAINAEISVIFQDRIGRLWIGTQGGLAMWDEMRWQVFTTADGLAANDVRALAEDADGSLWIGTSRGLNRLRDGKFTAVQPDDQPSGETISSLFVDAQNVLWIGTDGNGLARLRQGKWTRYKTSDGLISNSIGYLIEDGQGYLWMGSYVGLMRVAKSALADYADAKTSTISGRTYGRAEGLPTSECSQGSQPTVCRTHDGRLWFPTIKGLVSLDPAQLKTNPAPPPVVIESVVVEGRAISTNGLRAQLPDEVVIPPGRERLEIQFTCLNLAARDRARFKYRLEGHETTPVEVGGEVGAATYSQLPPGHYLFRVTACNEDGVWNPIDRTLAIVVLPPFWKTWWFRTAGGLCLLAVIIGIVHNFSTQKYRRQLESLHQQEALEKERSRIARDIHDQLGASLTQVAFLGELLEEDKGSPTEVEAHARQISHTARATADALDEIVWTVNPANDTLEGLVTYFCKHAQEYASVAGLQYRLDVPTHLPPTPISPEVRHNLFLAAKEAVTNIVRHAQAKSVWVRVKLEPTTFILEIADDGRGPAGMEAKTSRNGLRNMRKRMEDVGGNFGIGPAPEGGTLVRLTMPIGKL